ncbi:hypothetical protein QR680_009432 [Steinernema hermaphroditum]|uniref:Uncharacterized protein n=1 Tax=Steinernema hermaphroditum TaxID=289476 RepID=A0AA39IK66_9BILA|nr:hypothetical protein QR680_009432 [Steinernema hermaphroditum]
MTHLCEEELAAAQQQCVSGMQACKGSVRSALGLASVAYLRGEYNRAANCLKSVITYRGRYAPNVHLLLGYCFYERGYEARARHAFEMALDFNPHYVEAMVALATVDHNKDGFTASVKWLVAAWEHDKTNPLVLNRLSEYFFHKGEIEKAQHLADKALHCSLDSRYKALSCYNLAKCSHAIEDYNSAYDWYLSATSSDASFATPYFGLAQLHIRFSEFSLAIQALRKLDCVFMKNSMVLRVLGRLLVDEGQPADAEHFLRKALEGNTDGDLEMRIMLAQILQDSDEKRSLDLYNEVRLLRESENERAPPEIYNNIGAHHFRMENLASSLQNFKLALKSFPERIFECEQLVDTVEYNLGRCYEQLGDHINAIETYNRVLSRTPSYADCHLRLGLMDLSVGQFLESEMHFCNVLAIDEGSISAMAMIGNLHMGRKQIQEAQASFGRAIELRDDDSYCITALGNAYRELFMHSGGEPKTKTYILDRSAMFYEKALFINPRNVYAANGLGCVLALMNQFDKACEVFERIRECSVKPRDLWGNLGYTYLKLGLFLKAASFLEIGMRQCGHEIDEELVLALSKAYEKSDQLQKCREILAKAVSSAPDVRRCSFYYARCLKDMGVKVVENHRSRPEALLEAVKDIKRAATIFKSLRNHDGGNVATICSKWNT